MDAFPDQMDAFPDQMDTSFGDLPVEFPQYVDPFFQFYNMSIMQDAWMQNLAMWQGFEVLIWIQFGLNGFRRRLSLGDCFN